MFTFSKYIVVRVSPLGPWARPERSVCIRIESIVRSRISSVHDLVLKLCEEGVGRRCRCLSLQKFATCLCLCVFGPRPGVVFLRQDPEEGFYVKRAKPRRTWSCRHGTTARGTPFPPCWARLAPCAASLLGPTRRRRTTCTSCSTVWWIRHPSSTGGGSARVA